MGEVDRGCKRQNGEVVVGGVVVVARVLGDGGDVVPVRHGVRGVVLAHQHLTQCALGWFTEPLTSGGVFGEEVNGKVKMAKIGGGGREDIKKGVNGPNSKS